MARQVSETQEVQVLDLPIDPALLFSDHENIYERKLERRQTRLLRKLGFLKSFLQDGEKIVFVTTAYSPASFLEQFLSGWLYFCLRRCLLVFTNKRILHIPTQPTYSPRRVIAQIRYPDCETIFLRGRHLVVHYQQGTTEEFLVAARKRKVESVLSAIPWQGKPSSAPGRIHLCPRCGKEIFPRTYACPHCQLAFKDETHARWIAALCPGGGYFYTRHPWVGVGTAMVELSLLALAAGCLREVVNGNSQFFAVLFIAAIAFLIEKTASMYLATRLVREPLPRQRKVKPHG